MNRLGLNESMLCISSATISSVIHNWFVDNKKNKKKRQILIDLYTTTILQNMLCVVTYFGETVAVQRNQPINRKSLELLSVSEKPQIGASYDSY